MIGHENDGVVPTWIATRREQLRVSPVAVLNLCKDIGIVPSIIAGTGVNQACERASRKGASNSVRHDGKLNFPEFLEAVCYVANIAFAKDKTCQDARDRLFAFLNRLNGSYGFEFNAKLREFTRRRESDWMLCVQLDFVLPTLISLAYLKPSASYPSSLSMCRCGAPQEQFAQVLVAPPRADSLCRVR